MFSVSKKIDKIGCLISEVAYGKDNMDKLIAPIISTILLVIVGVVGYIIFTKIRTNEKEKAKAEDRGETAQDLTNVIDIDDNNNLLYTADNNILSLIKIESVSLDLMSDTEKKIVGENLTTALGKYGGSWKFIAVSRPVDTKPLIDRYNHLCRQTESTIRKNLLRNAAKTMELLSLGGEVTERQFYFILWNKYKDNATINDFIKKRALFVNELSEAKAKVDIVKKPEMIRVFNLYFNPSVLNYESYDDEDDAVVFMK